MTRDNFFEKYVVGNEGKLEDSKIQKLWVDYGFIDILIDSLDIITNKDVIHGILNSNLWENENYILKTGKIISIKLLENKEIVEHLYEISIEFLDENGLDKYLLKGLGDKNEINKYINQDIKVIIEKEKDNVLRYCCFLKEEIMEQSKTKQLNELFERWQNDQREESNDSWENKTKGNTKYITKNHFCEDGIINENIFAKENKKVLFISNEANDDYEIAVNRIKTSRVQAFKEYSNLKKDNWNGKLRERVCALYKVIIKNYEIPEYQVAENFAFMNINKRGGGKNIKDENYKKGNNNHIEEYCKYYANYIKEEIEIINPDIIIWLGVETYDMDLHIKYLGATKKEDGKVFLNNIPILRMWHPSYIRMKNKPSGKFKNKILDKFATKLEEELKRYNI